MNDEPDFEFYLRCDKCKKNLVHLIQIPSQKNFPVKTSYVAKCPFCDNLTNRIPTQGKITMAAQGCTMTDLKMLSTGDPYYIPKEGEELCQTNILIKLKK